MKIYFLCTCVVLFFVSSFVMADVFVHGHYKKNGAYIAPHHRSEPNATQSDNWSAKGNQNPYTGKKGSKSHSNTAKKNKTKMKMTKSQSQNRSAKKAKSSRRK